MSTPRRFADVCFQDPKYDRFKRMNLVIAEERKAQASAPPLPKVEPKVEVKEREVKGDPINAGDINPGTKMKVECLDRFKKTENWNRRSGFCSVELKRAMDESLATSFAINQKHVDAQAAELRRWRAVKDSVPVTPTPTEKKTETPNQVVVTDTGKKDKETPREGTQVPARGISLARLPFYRSLSSLSLPALNKKNLCLFVAVLVVTGLVMYGAYHHHDLGTETAKVDIVLNCPPENEGLLASMVAGVTRAIHRCTWHLMATHEPDMSLCKSAMAKVQINQRYSFPLLESIWHAFASLLEIPYQALCNLVYNALKYPFELIGRDIINAFFKLVKYSLPVVLFQFACNKFGVKGMKVNIGAVVVKIGSFVCTYGPAILEYVVQGISSSGDLSTPLN